MSGELIPEISPADKFSTPRTKTYRDGDVFTGVLKVVAPFPVQIDLGQV